MWLGLLYLPVTVGDDDVILCAWQRGRDRPFTLAGPRHAAPDMARALRQIGAGGLIEAPRCDACSTPIDLPPL